jgi:hypothetical protein
MTSLKEYRKMSKKQQKEIYENLDYLYQKGMGSELDNDDWEILIPYDIPMRERTKESWKKPTWSRKFW